MIKASIFDKSHFLTYLPQAANSYEKFDTVTHLGQITKFDPFWGTLGVKWASKRSKIVHVAKKLPQKQKICAGGWVFFHEKFNLVTYILHSKVFDPFWGTLEFEKDKKLPISLKNNPQMQHICTCRSCFKRNSMVSLIFDKIIHSTIWVGSNDAPMYEYVCV